MRRIVVSAALILSANIACASAETTRLDLTYSVYLTGIPIGRATVTVDLNEKGFVVAGHARTARFVSLISKGNGSATVRGSLQPNRSISSFFSGRYSSSRREQKIEIQTENGAVKDVSIEPAPNPDPSRVPVTRDSQKNVIDPLSAALAFISTKGDVLNPTSCNRTLPIFDGRYRFDVVLSFARTEEIVGSGEGYRGPVLVCRARYVPIAGHRKDAKSTEQMANNRDMLVWLAPVTGTRVLVPIKASVSSPIGTFTAEATTFKIGQR